ncbi:MAG: hypothetical protein V3V15_09410 [Sphingorhabdus sp.]
MKYVAAVVLAMMTVLSILAGGVKLLKMPQEIQFFADAGISSSWLLPLGALQILGGLLAIPRKSRQGGLSIIALGFLASTIVIFMTGNAGFGLFSLAPVLLCCFLVWQAGTKKGAS